MSEFADDPQMQQLAYEAQEISQPSAVLRVCVCCLVCLFARCFGFLDCMLPACVDDVACVCWHWIEALTKSKFKSASFGESLDDGLLLCK